MWIEVLVFFFRFVKVDAAFWAASYFDMEYGATTGALSLIIGWLGVKTEGHQDPLKA